MAPGTSKTTLIRLPSASTSSSFSTTSTATSSQSVLLERLKARRAVPSPPQKKIEKKASEIIAQQIAYLRGLEEKIQKGQRTPKELRKEFKNTLTEQVQKRFEYTLWIARGCPDRFISTENVAIFASQAPPVLTKEGGSLIAQMVSELETTLEAVQEKEVRTTLKAFDELLKRKDATQEELSRAFQGIGKRSKRPYYKM